MKQLFTFLLISSFILTGISLPQENIDKNPAEKNKTSFEKNPDNIKAKSSTDFPDSYSSIFNTEESPHDLTEGNINKQYTAFSPNYFRIDESGNSLWDGKHWNESDFPLEVFIKKSFSKYFKSEFLKYIDYAFKIWETADDRIEFKYVDSDTDADIIISFESNLMDKYDENYLGLTCYGLNEDNSITRSFVEIGMLKFDTEVISNGEVKATIIHEIGHALGLGHSNNEIDLMYPYISPGSSNLMTFVELSRGDQKAIQSLINLGFKRKYSKR